MHRSLRIFVGTASALLACVLLENRSLAQYGEVPAPPPELKAGFDTITAEQASEWLHILAGPTFGGRGTGQAGYTKAAHWVAGKVAEFGLEPIGDGGTYFQEMPLAKRSVDLANCRITGPDGLEIPGEGNLGFDRFTDDVAVEGEVVFLHLVGDNPELPEGFELRDKIVVYSTDEAARRRAFRLLAGGRPAASLRIVDAAPDTAPQTLFPGRSSRSTSVSGSIRAGAASDLANTLGVALEHGEATSAVASGKKVDLQLRFREEQAVAPNVVAWVEGSDPDLRNEYIVIGAHLDHLGTRGGEMYPGADDNGSGSTAVLSIARAIAANPLKPKRSILFIWFAGEEVGLVGSRYYTGHPLKPLENMTCMLNIDMVGRNEDQGEGDADADNEGHIHLVGSQRGETDLHNIVLEANKYVGFEFELDMESVWNRSDQVNFYNEGVPVAFMFGGFHPDYHQPGDLPSKINYHKIASAARLYYVALHLAARHEHFEMKKETAESSGK
jgi:hypothetical protein